MTSHSNGSKWKRWSIGKQQYHITIFFLLENNVNTCVDEIENLDSHTFMILQYNYLHQIFHLCNKFFLFLHTRYIYCYFFNSLIYSICFHLFTFHLTFRFHPQCFALFFCCLVCFVYRVTIFWRVSSAIIFLVYGHSLVFTPCHGIDCLICHWKKCPFLCH